MGIVYGITALFIAMFVLVVVYAIAVYCCFHSIQTGMTYVAMSQKFLK